MVRLVPAAIGFAAFFVTQSAAEAFGLTLAGCGAVFAAAFFVPYVIWRHLRDSVRVG